MHCSTSSSYHKSKAISNIKLHKESKKILKIYRLTPLVNQCYFVYIDSAQSKFKQGAILNEWVEIY